MSTDRFGTSGPAAAAGEPPLDEEVRRAAESLGARSVDVDAAWSRVADRASNSSRRTSRLLGNAAGGRSWPLIGGTGWTPRLVWAGAMAAVIALLVGVGVSLSPTGTSHIINPAGPGSSTPNTDHHANTPPSTSPPAKVNHTHTPSTTTPSTGPSRPPVVSRPTGGTIATGTASDPLSCFTYQWGGPSGSVPGPLTVTEQLGAVTAIVSGSRWSTLYGAENLVDATIRIAVNGTVIYEASIAAPMPGPGGGLVDPNWLCVGRFGPVGVVPVAVMSFFSGGAHCCFSVRAWPITDQTVQAVGSGTTMVIHEVSAPVNDNLENVNATLNAEGDSAVVVTAVNAFNYTFGPYALSGVPVEVLSLVRGAWTTVTDHYPSLITSDASKWWGVFNRNPGDGLGALAAWAADECLLQQPPWSELATLNAEGKLRTTGLQQWPKGSAYISALRSFLPGNGYAC